jgi:hypothetical protein
MFKSIILSSLLIVSPVTISWAAYTSSFTVLEKKDIIKLSDDEITNAYMDALVEVQARKDFFGRFGFAGKDLDDYKSILKYRLILLLEIHSRNLDIPQFERY